MTDRDLPYKTHEEVMEELLEDPGFREAYEELQPEYALKEAIVRARVEGGITQAELAERMGVKQPAIARMETGPFDPRLTTLRKLAAALGVRFEIGAEGLRVIPAGEKATSRQSRGNRDSRGRPEALTEQKAH